MAAKADGLSKGVGSLSAADCICKPFDALLAITRKTTSQGHALLILKNVVENLQEKYPFLKHARIRENPVLLLQVMRLGTVKK